MPRVRIEFSKGEQVRFLSHLDLMKTVERAIRRAEIPIAFSEGFNPHPKINFASALAVGVTSDKEYMDIDLKHEVDLKELVSRFAAAFPPGIQIKQGRFVSEKSPALMAVVNRADYKVVAQSQGEIEQDTLDNMVDGFMEATEVVITKRTKKGPRQKNIRPGILEFKGKAVGDKAEFFVSVRLANEGNIRPEEVISAFKERSGIPLDCEALNIKRLDLFVEKDGESIDPMDI